jgi:hypothetical protein
MHKATSVLTLIRLNECWFTLTPLFVRPLTIAFRDRWSPNVLAEA